MHNDTRSTTPPNHTRAVLQRQFETAWQLLSWHLDGLSSEECLWRPAARGLHVSPAPDGTWRADWPEHERYDLGPSSAAWITWHIHFWWSMVLDHHWGPGTLSREGVTWPGSALAVKAAIASHRERWVQHLTAADWPVTARWPVTERPFVDVVAWLNLELMKNAAELGSVRFLYAVRPT